MGAEYRHGLAISDLTKFPRTDTEFKKLEEKVSKLLFDYQLIENCVERRTGESRSCRLESDGTIGKWKDQKQNLKSSAHDSLKKEYRLDWKPLDREESVKEIAGGDFSYGKTEKRPETQWIYLQCGPNFKVFDDSTFERIQTKEFECTNCGSTIKESATDPWIPGMLEGFSICQSQCDCGGDITPAEIRYRSTRTDRAPDITVWKVALFIDFGKCHPDKVIWSGQLQSKTFRNDLEKTLGSNVIEFGCWY